MIHPLVHTLHSPDAEPDEYVPDDPDNVRIFIQAMVGDTDGPGEETFNLEVFSPAALARRVREEGPVTGRHLVIVERWDYSVVGGYLRHAFESEKGADWDTLGRRLGRIGRWEFEDYDETRNSWDVPPGVGATVRSMRVAGAELSRYSPPDRDDFDVAVELAVAAANGSGEGAFTVGVCSPASLARRVRAEAIFLGEHLLIAGRWDHPAVATALTRMFESQDGATWAELADRLSRYGRRTG